MPSMRQLKTSSLSARQPSDLGPSRQPRLGRRHRSEQASSYLLKLPKASALPSQDVLAALNDLLGSVGVRQKEPDQLP